MCCDANECIHLYVVFDTPKVLCRIPKSSLLVPINSTLSQGDTLGPLSYYCELRAQYWVWKNNSQTPDSYVGFFHYRRYLELNKLSSTKKLCPYHILFYPNVENYTYQQLWPLLQNYDIIAPIPEYTGTPVWIRYASTPGHNLEELIYSRRYIAEHAPDYLADFDQYMTGKREYYCNMFVMRWKHFDSYCQWLFPILQDVEQHLGKALMEKSLGYLGERLFGVYFTKHAREGALRCSEVPRVHYSAYDDKTHHFRKLFLVNILLPPGSKRRAWIKNNTRRMRYQENEYGAYFNNCNSNL